MDSTHQISGGTALVLTAGMLQHSNAKTAHGLIRGSERFQVVGVIDTPSAGLDAGEIVDGQPRQIPVFATLTEALAVLPKPDYCIVGVATVGGILPPELLELIREAITRGISIVNGLHDFLHQRPDIQALAAQHQVQLIDVRAPKAKKDLHFWTGAIYSVACPIIAVLGMDCAMGKRTTARFIRQYAATQGWKAEMIYTGQTGWMQGGRYGFVFDSTLNDFVSGELEHAIVSAYREQQPDFILLEGQSALRNPSGPCGAEFLVSGNARYVVLVHQIKRIYYGDEPQWGLLPTVASEIALIQAYGAQVIALALNTAGCTPEEVQIAKADFAAELGLPILLPIEEGVAPIHTVLQNLLQATPA